MRLINEWEKHSGTILIWPYDNSVWGWDIQKIQEAVANIANTITCYEPVYLLINNNYKHQVERMVSRSVFLIDSVYDRIWIRDSSPIWCSNNSRLLALNFQYADYSDRKSKCLNSELSKFISDYFGACSIDIPLELEGGNIATNKSVVATCGKAKSYKTTSIESLKNMLCELKINNELLVIHDNPLKDKSYHIDNIISFPKDDTIFLYEGFQESNDEWISLKNKRVYNISHPIVTKAHEAPKRLPISYLNYYQFNNAVILPQFGYEEYDCQALTIFKDVFINKEIIPINASDIILGGGGIHCITKEIPLI